MRQYIKENLRVLLEDFNPYQAELDMLLDKISTMGMENLTGAEKHQLKNVSQGKAPDALSPEEMDMISNFGKEEGMKFGFEEFHEHLRMEMEERFGEDKYMFYPDYHEKTIQIRKYVDVTESQMFGMIKWVGDNRVCYEHTAFKYKFCEDPHYFLLNWLEEFKGSL